MYARNSQRKCGCVGCVERTKMTQVSRQDWMFMQWPGVVSFTPAQVASHLFAYVAMASTSQTGPPPCAHIFALRIIATQKKYCFDYTLWVVMPTSQQFILLQCHKTVVLTQGWTIEVPNENCDTHFLEAVRREFSTNTLRRRSKASAPGKDCNSHSNIWHQKMTLSLRFCLLTWNFLVAIVESTRYIIQVYRYIAKLIKSWSMCNIKNQYSI